MNHFCDQFYFLRGKDDPYSVPPVMGVTERLPPHLDTGTREDIKRLIDIHHGVNFLDVQLEGDKMVIIGLGVLFPADTFANGLKAAIGDSKIEVSFPTYGEASENHPEEIINLAESIQAKGYFDKVAYKVLIQSIQSFSGLEVEVRAPLVWYEYGGLELYIGDTPWFTFSLHSGQQNVMGRPSDVLSLIYFKNNTWYWETENYTAARTLELFFQVWSPTFVWADTDDGLEGIVSGSRMRRIHDHLRKKGLNPERSQGLEYHQTKQRAPWRVYEETMIFGPQLVKELGLKYIDWAELGVFFHKWVTEDILWLAGPEGVRSSYGPFYTPKEREALGHHHRATVIETLSLKYHPGVLDEAR